MCSRPPDRSRRPTRCGEVALTDRGGKRGGDPLRRRITELETQIEMSDQLAGETDRFAPLKCRQGIDWRASAPLDGQWRDS
jgi:hypothetical protein